MRHPSPAVRAAFGRRPLLAASLAAVLAAAACEPTVKLQAPDKPIVINLNVKIEQEIRVKVEKDIEDLLRQDDELF